MKGKSIQNLFSWLLGLGDLFAFIFSLQPTVSKWVSATSFASLLCFAIIFLLEFFRKRGVSNLMSTKPPLNDTELELRAMLAKDNIVNKLTASKITKWEYQRQEEIQVINKKYLSWQRALFAIGIIIAILTLILLLLG